jgi:hypothetical protein
MGLIAETMDDERRADDRVLFCPFCRESYEGLARCPEHELDLVEFHALPKQAHERQGPGWEDVIAPWDVRFGRGFLAAGVAATVIGFFSPFTVGTVNDLPVSWSGFEGATGPAPNLWTIPFVAVMFVYFLYRRRTPLAMRGARLAGVLLSLAPSAAVIYSMLNVLRGADRRHVAIEWGWGVYVIFAATVLLFIGSIRFGALPADGAVPHGAEPEGEDPIARDEEPKARRRRRRR